MIEGVTAVALQGQTKKTWTFHLEEVKTEHDTSDVCEKCVCYSTNVATVDLGTPTENSKSEKQGKKGIFYVVDSELVKLLPREVVERRQMIPSGGKEPWRNSWPTGPRQILKTEAGMNL